MPAALLDTHTFIWLVTGDTKLSAAALALAKDPKNRLVLSAASAWKISIKVALARLEIDVPLEQLFSTVLQQFRIEWLPIQPAHLVQVARLPFHHRNPFDRRIRGAVPRRTVTPPQH
jgi:PIN domain nuclease of toxin-antitoxin system